MSTLADIQRQLLVQDMVLTINAKILLPRVGGYNARPYSSELGIVELPRPSEIKFLWRWWMRAILSGVYGGKKKYNELDEEIGKVLGSIRNQSTFSIAVDLNVDPDTYKRMIEKIELCRKLICNVIPEALEKFIDQWTSDKDLKNMGIPEIRLTIPISIELRSRQWFNTLKNLFKNRFGINNIKHKRGRATISLESSNDLKNLITKLNMKLNVSINQLTAIYENLVRIGKIPRVRIILQPRKEEGENNKLRGKLSEKNKKYLKRISEDIAPLIALTDIGEIPIKITIAMNREHQNSNEKFRFAIATLLLSLFLGSTGSIAGRGFGSIVVNSINVSEKYKELLKEDIEKVNKILESKSENDLEHRLAEYINYVTKIVKSIYKGDHDIHSKDLKLPEVPSLMLHEYFRLRAIKCEKCRNVIELLSVIGKATLKSEWKKRIYPNSSNPERKPGKDIHTWILGLPRRSEETGYYIIEDNQEKPGRRSSAVNFKIFENRYGERFVLIYGFISKDWPINKLIHKSKYNNIYKNNINQSLRGKSDEEIIKEVFENAFNMVLNIVENCCARDCCKGGGRFP